MMKKVKTIYHLQSLRGRFFVAILAFVAMLLGATQAEAQQRVHIGLDNGSLLNAYASDDDLTDSGWGFSALWRHQQLALSVTGSDRDGLLDSGNPSIPSTVFGKHWVTENGKTVQKMTIVGGRRPSFIVVSLPKGYRILSYKMELVNDLAPNDYYNELQSHGEDVDSKWQYINSNNTSTNRWQMGNGQGTMRFYETARWETNGTNSGTTARSDDNGDLGYNSTRVRYIAPGSNWENGNQIGSAGLPNSQYDYIAQAVDASGNGDIYSNDRGSDKVFTISRTAQQTGEDQYGVPTYDMGNQLYFRLVKDYYGYGLTIKSFEITFNAEGTFEAEVVPEAVGEACSVVKAPFETSKIDIGTMGVEEKEGRAFFSYNYKNVKDLVAYNYLYQAGAVANGVPSEDATNADNKHIRPVQVTAAGKSQLLYALGSDTYFIEPPIEIATPTINEETGEPYTAPIGYRIVGALFTPLWGQSATGYNPGAYTLKIWKHDGSKVLHTVVISDADDTDLNKVYDVGLCNNDAIKFEIETGAINTQALVQVTLLLQALDPYIEKMDIVCTDENKKLTLTQSFTADDFSVSGGKFIFYVPEDYRNNVLTFTFSDLYTKYGDETYYGGSIGTSRYSYVTSDYFKLYSGNQVAGVTGFPINDGLYEDGKNADGTSNGRTAYTPESEYTEKVFTSTAGTVRFKFNNAEDLAKQGIADEDFTGSLIEYPFSVTEYLDGYEDPDFDEEEAGEGETAKTGNFLKCELMANPTADYQNTGIFYVFTADETRWNIAPTTNWQHRFYAFYTMEIEAKAKSFQPLLEWTKIYDKTCYDKDGNGTDTFDSMWGLSLQAADKDDYEDGKITIVPEGYLTYQEIINHVLGRGEEGDDDYIPTALDDTNTEAPASMKQILYVDGSKLYAMVNSSTKQENTNQLIVITLNDLKKELSKNNLVFLPEGTIEKVDNAAYKVSSGFQAGNDIVLYDKNPFFSPYDISVGADNYAKYTRDLTLPDWTQVTNATVMLPFTLRLENGTHTNPDDGFAFTVNKMKEVQGDMAAIDGRNVNFGTSYFATIGKAAEGQDPIVSWTEANVPYMIQVKNVDGTLENSDKISFVAAQKGSDIHATPTVKDAVTNIGMKEIEGESATGSFGGDDYEFTNFGSYSGVKYDRAESQDIFYFAQNMYLNLHSLSRTKQYLYSYPFRGVYKYTTASTTPTPSGAKQMRGFYIEYGENPFQGVPTDINGQEAQPDLMVKVGKGEVTLSASRSQDVTFYTIGGITTKRIALEAGDTKTVTMPAGAYMVNGVKIIVK